ncbi:hypothetical protein EUGRSUZ_G00839 [Eucalyptus grandis]|uniref:Uncharacterized protein n=2 Tax=Eucalyptus grandis TaxID=71139 RepID=A0ACC3K3J1_EUCGR|nr:hypothetical protein EUGRSUZ_G00839 [Eucalyptus grandis]
MTAPSRGFRCRPSIDAPPPRRRRRLAAAVAVAVANTPSSQRRNPSRGRINRSSPSVAKNPSPSHVKGRAEILTFRVRVLWELLFLEIGQVFGRGG